jgi:hypothetical protein
MEGEQEMKLSQAPDDWKQLYEQLGVSPESECLVYHPALGAMTGSGETAMLLYYLLEIAEANEWAEIAVLGRRLKAKWSFTETHIWKLKSYLKRQPWCKVRDGYDNATYYLFEPNLLFDAVRLLAKTSRLIT